jgi:coiled-coil and C2 domain-containing protein 2A
MMQKKSNDNDGIYIHDAPSLRKISNKLLLLDRLHESATTELLDANGDLKNFEKLIDDDVYRLHCERKFTPIYVPPMPMNFEPLDKIISEKKFLKIFIGNLKFDQHKMFSSEHYAARMVEKLYGEYERRQKLSVVETLRKKLKNLRELKEESGSKESSLLQQIKNVRLKLHVEEEYDHKIVKSLLDNWKSLKTIRKQQNSAMTSISLKIQKLDSSDIVERQAERQQEYDAELNEMMSEEFDKYHSAKQKYKEFLKHANDPDKITQEHEEVVKKPKRPDIDKIVMELNGIYDKMPIHEPELRVILHHNDETTKPKEKLKKFNRISYRIELEVDGEVVGSTKNCRLDADFSIFVQSAFILKLTKHLPEKIKLMVNFIPSFFATLII